MPTTYVRRPEVSADIAVELEPSHGEADQRDMEEVMTPEEIVRALAGAEVHHATMYDDPRCIFCDQIVGHGHLEHCLARQAQEWVADGPHVGPEVRFVGLTFPHGVRVERSPGVVTIRRSDLEEAVSEVESSTRQLIPDYSGLSGRRIGSAKDPYP